MARVEIQSQAWGVLVDANGKPLSGQTATLKNLGGTNATIWTAVTGGSSNTSALSSDSFGGLGQSAVTRYVEEGTYTLEVGDITRRVEAVAGETTAFTHLRAHGAVDGGNIDTALTAALVELGANGGRIIIDAGNYTIASPPSFKETRNVILEGAGGENAGGVSPTRITYTGTAARAVDARSTYGFGMRDIQLLYSNASFTGILVDFDQSIAQDSAFVCIEKCYLGGAGISTAACCVSLNKTISSVIRDCNLSQAVLGVKGRNTASDYSNAITLDNVKFHLMTTAAIQAAGQAWRVVGCTFEQLASGNAGAYSPNAIGAVGVTFEGCWFGDGNTSGTWIDWAGSGLVVKGSYISTGAVGINLGGSSFGAEISGNQFDGPTVSIALAGSNSGISIIGNHFKVATDAITVGASTNGITITGNQFAASMDPVILDTGVQNALIVGNNMLPATTDVTYSGGGTMPSGSIIQRRSGHTMHILGLQEHTTTVADAQFPATPPNGTIAVENVAGVRKICVRLTGVWYKATLT